MIIGQETDLHRLMDAVAGLIEKCGQTILGDVDLNLNGRAVKGYLSDAEVAAMRDTLLTAYSRELAAAFVELRDVFGVVYTPEIYTVEEVKAAMISHFSPAPMEPAP